MLDYLRMFLFLRNSTQSPSLPIPSAVASFIRGYELDGVTSTMLESRIGKLNLLWYERIYIWSRKSKQTIGLFQEIHALRKSYYQLTRNNKVLDIVCPSKAQ